MLEQSNIHGRPTEKSDMAHSAERLLSLIAPVHDFRGLLCPKVGWYWTGVEHLCSAVSLIAETVADVEAENKSALRLPGVTAHANLELYRRHRDAASESYEERVKDGNKRHDPQHFAFKQFEPALMDAEMLVKSLISNEEITEQWKRCYAARLRDLVKHFADAAPYEKPPSVWPTMSNPRRGRGMG